MTDQCKMFLSLEETNPDQFLLGEFSKISLPFKTKDQKSSIAAISSFKERERHILQDLFCILIGKEGKYITYENLMTNDTFERLKGIKYKIDNDIDVNFRDITLKLMDLGTKVSSLLYFKTFFDRHVYGKVIGKLCEFIRNTLKTFQFMICQLNDSSHKDPSFSMITLFQQINNSSLDNTNCSAYKCISHLYDIAQLVIDENQKRLEKSHLIDMKFESLMHSLREGMNNNVLDDIIVDSQNSRQFKGGAILNVVYDQAQKMKGNANSYNFLQMLYETISSDYVLIINHWLENAEILDSFNEFFIMEDKSNKASYSSYYWFNKFAIKREVLLKQISSTELQKMIFFTGKYLRITRECEFTASGMKEHFMPIKSLQDKNLELLITLAYERANQKVIELLCAGYDFPNFMLMMNKHFLISDGSLFDNFLNLTNHELKRNFNSAFVYDISKAYEIIYTTNSHNGCGKLFQSILSIKFESKSFFEELQEIIKTKVTDAKDIMNAMDLKSLTDILKENIQINEQSTNSENTERETRRCGKLAISKLNIDIEIPFPINQVITESHKLEYQILFRHTAMIKFIEKRLEKSWRELGYQTFWTWSFDDFRVRKWIKRCRFIHTKMFDFVRLYLYYSKYEVNEANWARIDHTIAEFKNQNYKYDLSKFKLLITEYLSSSMSDLLLSQSNLTKCMYELLTLIFVFHEYVMSARKVLLFLDESLMDSQRQKYNFSFVYSSAEKEKKLKSVIQVLDSYHLAFQRKLVELCHNLSYYGGVDSPKLLILETLLVSTFKL